MGVMAAVVFVIAVASRVSMGGVVIATALIAGAPRLPVARVICVAGSVAVTAPTRRIFLVRPTTLALFSGDVVLRVGFHRVV